MPLDHLTATDGKRKREASARRIVADRMRQFFAAITGALRGTTEEFWQGVETRLGRTPERRGSEDGSSDRR